MTFPSRTTLIVALAVSGALLLSACSDDTQATSTQLTITGTDALAFEPARWPYRPARRSPSN